MGDVVIWHPDTEQTSSVPEGAVNAYRGAGWLRLDERDDWLAAVESGRAAQERLAAEAVEAAQAPKGSAAKGSGTKAGLSGEGS